MPDVIQIAIQATDLASKVIGGVGDSLDKLDKSADSAEKKLKLFGLTTDQIGSKMSSAGKIATVGLTLPIAGISVAAIKAASDLNETANKIDTLFGSASNEIKKFADTAATSLGQSKKQALDAAATFAVFGKSAGLAGQDLVAFSKQNVQLAADMASFFNTSPEEAITAIGAAFRGESEPIRRYGVLLDDASLKQQALRMGLIKTTTEALQPQQRVLAAQALIMQQTSAAAGDFAKTSGGLANQTRILEAQFQDVVSTLGQSLLPVAVKVASTANELLTAFNNLDQPTKDLIVGFGLMAAAAGPVLTIGGKLIGVFGTLGSISVDAARGLLSVGKTVGETAGYLKDAGVSVDNLKFAFQNLKGAGVILGAELGIIVAGLIAVAKYLGEVDAASKATNDSLIEMSHSGDVFKQAAATTEILINGQDRLKGALDGVKSELESSKRTYADYRSSITATAKAAGYEIDAAGNLVQAFNTWQGAQFKVIQGNYALSESEYTANNAIRERGGLVDRAVKGLIDLGQRINELSTAENSSVVTTYSQAESIRGLVETYNAGTTARDNFKKKLEESIASANAAVAAETAHRTAIDLSVTSVDKLAQSLSKATNAQAIQTLAQGQLDVLSKAYKDGQINADAFKKSTDAVLLRYGLATPKSLAMAEAQDKVNKAFLSGQLPLDSFIKSSEKIPKIASDGRITMQELASLGINPTTQAVDNQTRSVDAVVSAWAKVPATVTTTYNIVTNGEVPGGGSGGGGGPAPRPPGTGEPAATGANFIVPPGYPNDSFPMRVTSGEHVRVTPSGKGSGNPPAITITQTFNGAQAQPEQYKAIMYEVITDVFDKAMRQ